MRMNMLVLPVEDRLYTMTKRVEERLGDVAFAAYQVGDATQRGATEFVAHADHLNYVSGALCRLAATSVDGVRTLGSSRDRALALAELRKNVEVYRLVRRIRELLGVPERGRFPLVELVEKAYGLGTFPALWAVEGLGHDFVENALAERKELQRILIDPPADALPAGSLTMMHAGMGLAFAERLLPSLTPYSSPTRIRATLLEFLRSCVENARPGYQGAAYESLGLVARFWHPQMVLVIDRELQA